jgi:uncharacterized membrane protein
MASAVQYLPAAYSLTAVGVWGTSDFLGGVGARRVNAFLFTAIVHLSGLIACAAAAILSGAPFPPLNSFLWSFLAGLLGGFSLVFFYRALAQGNMGLIAPVSAVLSAAIPTVLSAFVDGAPAKRQIFGFLLAAVGVWLISRTESGSDRPKGFGIAVLAGIGFAGFYICAHQAGNASPLWIGTCSRCGSLAITGTIAVFGRLITKMPGRILTIALVAGVLDIAGSVFFIRAAQIGRLDEAVVISSLYPAITVLLARIFLHEHFSRARTLGMFAALCAVPMIAS